MNCETYIRAITADPSESFDGGALHSAECSSCSAYKVETQALDAKIAAALKIDVPKLEVPELPAVRGDVVELESRRPIKWTNPAWLALAASVVLVTAIGFRFIDNDVSDRTLAQQVIAHLDHEPQALKVTKVTVSDQKLYSVVRPTVATLDRNIGLITYARSCKINGREVPHLVVQGERGPVTILLMPYETVDMPVPLDGQSIEGVILPVGEGSIAIIGERGESIDRVGSEVRDALEWGI